MSHTSPHFFVLPFVLALCCLCEASQFGVMIAHPNYTFCVRIRLATRPYNKKSLGKNKAGQGGVYSRARCAHGNQAEKLVEMEKIFFHKALFLATN